MLHMLYKGKLTKDGEANNHENGAAYNDQTHNGTAAETYEKRRLDALGGGFSGSAVGKSGNDKAELTGDGRENGTTKKPLLE